MILVGCDLHTRKQQVALLSGIGVEFLEVSQRGHCSRALRLCSAIAGTVKVNVAPPSLLFSAQSWPPWASINDRAIDNPIPNPDDFVV